ncbi:MAG: WhiB family transcriptional regulator [Propionibacteriaceae bacterium]
MTALLPQLPGASGGVHDGLPCHRVDPDLFFAESPLDVERAKAMCGDCPLRSACLDGALERKEPWGVWGGELLVAGAVVARKRPRGRPRKHPVEPAAASAAPTRGDCERAA